MRKSILKRTAAIAFAAVLSFACLTASAKSADNAYTYDSWGNAVEVPSGYEATLSFGTEKAAVLKSPMDMYACGDKLYVLDAGNNRIVIYNADFKPEKIIDKFYITENGTKSLTELNEAQGIFVTSDGRIYIADTANARVIICNTDGMVKTVLTKPETENFPDSLQFKPINVLVDDADNTYVLADGFYYGAIVYDAEGNYKSFYGASKVKVTASLIADRFWRKFMTGKQLDYTRNYLPATFTSFDIDSKNFIYTVTADKSGAIRQLNYLGNDIFSVEQGPDPLDKSVYGDRTPQYIGGTWYNTSFADIAVSEEDFVYVLDRTNGRVFQYDKDSNLINVFGAKGNQKGTFKTPAAIETVGRNVLVLDQDKGEITLFEPTDYGNVISDATVLYHKGLFDEAFDKWQTVLSYNSNCDLAYRGIGRAYLQQGKYAETMKYAKLGQDRLGYSKAFRFYRSQLARKYFVPAAAVLAVITAAAVIISKNREKIRQRLNISPRKPRLFKAKNIMLHSVNFYEKLHTDKSKTTFISACVVVFLFFIGQIIASLATGFIFNKNNITEFNGFFITAQSLGFVAIWVLSDTVVGSLRFGHGNVLNIFNGTAAALVPYTATIYINIILSHLFVYEEQGIMSIISAIGLLYTVFLLYQSTRINQKYTVLEAAASMLLDVLVAVIIILLLVIIYMLVRQMFIFAATVFQEIIYRIN